MAFGGPFTSGQSPYPLTTIGNTAGHTHTSTPYLTNLDHNGNAVAHINPDWVNKIDGIQTTANLAGGTITFVSNNRVLFSIMPDGRIAKGEAFTTDDEMSIAFWDKVAENFSVAWWKSLIRDQRK